MLSCDIRRTQALKEPRTQSASTARATLTGESSTPMQKWCIWVCDRAGGSCYMATEKQRMECTLNKRAFPSNTLHYLFSAYRRTNVRVRVWYGVWFPEITSTFSTVADTVGNCLFLANYASRVFQGCTNQNMNNFNFCTFGLPSLFC